MSSSAALTTTTYSAITELEDLRLFLQERVQAYDESIDTTRGAAFDTEVIQPLLVRLGPDPYNTPIRAFILGRLRTEFPDLVLQDGEPIDDYAVKIMQILLEAFRRQIRLISLNQSVANPEAMNEREADNLGANYFARRNLGGYSVGIARVYYSSPQFALVTPSNPVFDASGHQFYPVENQAIQSDRMLFNEEDGLYYFDIVVRAAAQGEDYDIEDNTLTGIEGVAGAVKVRNKRSFTEGGNKESTIEFLERVEQGLTEKSLVTVRGINARLQDTFESIRLIQVIGHGSPEMNRDILTGASQAPPYAMFEGSTPNTGGAGTSTVNLGGWISTGDPTVDDFEKANVRAGDILLLWGGYGGEWSDYVVEHLISATELSVTPNLPDNLSPASFSIRREEGVLTISDIPGGILQPTTPAGTIEITDGQVHIGGALDVFVRAGAPQKRDITLEGILDAEPLHFGIDLESFGERYQTEGGQFVHVTELLEDRGLAPSTDKWGDPLALPLAEILIRRSDSGANPWIPTEEDVGRYIQLLGPSDYGTFEITGIVGSEYYDDTLNGLLPCTRIQISVAKDYESGSVTPPFLTATTVFNLNIRLVDRISIANKVRDRNGSTIVIPENIPNPGDPDIVGGVDFESEGVDVGDSVVIETGEDAGIYSVRRKLSWLNDHDTLVLDRNLTKTVTPVGAGGGTGLRYRIADELNVDLVTPKITKIPLGDIFAGEDLSTVAGSANVLAGGSTNFLLAGVEEGDTLEILEGDNTGKYGVVSVAGNSVVLDAPTPNSGFSQSFEVYKAFTGVTRPLVRVEEIELLDSNSQPTGIKVPYGDTIDARIFGALSNRGEGTTVESFTGELKSNGSGLYRLEDPNRDFVAEDVKEDYRINILSGLSAGNYTIAEVVSGTELDVAPEEDGGKEFISTEPSVHYSIGLTSAGVARIYFLEPTTVEIDTGLAGGRLQFLEGGAAKEYRFSEVSGYPIVPAGASDEDSPRDLRVVRSWDIGGGQYKTIAELTDPSRPGVFELEIEEGDTFEVNEQLAWRAEDGQTLEGKGVFGKPSGLRTLSGSNEVTIPDNSLIDFVAMNNSFPLVGQLLIINEGPDAGQYTIEEVVTSKRLRISQVMSSSTGTILGADRPAPSLSPVIPLDPAFRDAALADDTDKSLITDTTDQGQLKVGALANQFITIFESTRADLDGVWEISDTLDAGPADTIQIDTKDEFVKEGSSHPELDPYTVGVFSWVRTSSDTLVEQPFGIYRAVPEEFMVSDVATKREDVVYGVRRGTVAVDLQTISDADAGFTVGAKQGDMLEVLSGPNAGIYTLESDSGEGALSNNQSKVHPNPSFVVSGSDIPYRIWGGIHGSQRMVTLVKRPESSGNGLLRAGEQMPYRVLKPKTLRVSSTEMQDNFDGSLYYIDVLIESQGAGDDLSIEVDSRLVTQGLKVDGYTYTVDNETLTFSTFEEVSLNFDRRFLPLGNSDSPENLTEISGRNLRVAYESSTPVSLVNDLMRSDNDRPVNASPLARHFLPSFVFAQFNYAGGVSESLIGADMESYINTLGAEDELEISDLEALITRRGATYVKHPITLVTVTHDLGRQLVVNRSDDKLGGLNEVPYNGTGRISAFFAKLGEGLILTRES